jgi:hypothetical protein
MGPKRTVPSRARPRVAAVPAPAGMRDAWLQKARPRGPWTWAELKPQFRAFVPAAECKSLFKTLQQWGTSPDQLKPLLRLVRNIVFSNAVHRAERKHAEWAAGTARDPHYKLTPETPGALHPLLDIVDRVIADLQHLSRWEFKPPIVLRELDAKLKPTRRTVRLSRLDESMREAFEKARQELLGVRVHLCEDTRRGRGRKATRVLPYRVSVRSRSTEVPKPARRRELTRMLGAQLLALNPDWKTRRAPLGPRLIA